MQTKYLIETTCSGSKQFVRIQRPSTHHHHHHHHHRRRSKQPDACHDDAPAPPRTDAVRSCHRHAGCLHVPVDEWNDLVRAERSLRKKNDKLQAENKSLARKAKDLCEANDALRCEVERLGRDNDCMAVRIRDLVRSRRHSADEQVEEYRRLARSWQDKFEAVQAVVDEKAGIVRGQRETIAMYERLLRRHGILAG